MAGHVEEYSDSDVELLASICHANARKRKAEQLQLQTEKPQLPDNNHDGETALEAQAVPMTESQSTEWMLKMMDEMDEPKAPAPATASSEFKLYSYVSGVNPPEWMTAGRELPAPEAASSKSEQAEEVLTETQQLMQLLQDEDEAPARPPAATAPSNGAAQKGVIWSHMLTKRTTVTSSEQQLRDILHDLISK